MNTLKWRMKGWYVRMQLRWMRHQLRGLRRRFLAMDRRSRVRQLELPFRG